MQSELKENKMGLRKKLAYMYFINTGVLLTVVISLVFIFEVMEVRKNYEKSVLSNETVLVQANSSAVNITNRAQTERTQNLRQVYLKLLVGSFISIFISLLATWLFVKRAQKIFSEPIYYILDVMNVVKEYDDYQVRTGDHREKLNGILEFHQLSEVFDNLLSDISSKKSEIQDYAINLELKVQEKTDEIKQLEASNIEASKLSALSVMASGIAHEVNNPLQIVNGNTWFIKKYISKSKTLSEEEKEKINQKLLNIDITIARAADIIQGLKKFSRDSDGDEPEEIDINDLVESTLAFCRGRFKREGCWT